MKRLLLVLVGLGAAVAAAVAWYRPWDTRARELRLPGTVEVQEVRLASKVGGRVTAVLVNESDVVEPGRVLVRFDPAELTARRDLARARVAAATAAREKADAGPLPEEIAEAKALADAARARLARAKAGFREEQRRQAEHDLAAAAAERRQAAADHDRVARLWQTGAVGQGEYDAARTARDRTDARYAAAKAAWDLLVAGTRLEDIDEAEADLGRYAARYELLNRGTRAEDKAAARAAEAEARAQLDEAETNLREAVVVAPERCVIETLPVRAGTVLSPGQPVLLALRAGDLWVKAFVPATDLGHVRLGQAVGVTVDSHPGRRFTGTVIHIATVSEFTPRNVQSIDERRHQVFAVKVRVADPDGVFKSGMAADVFVPLGGP